LARQGAGGSVQAAVFRDILNATGKAFPVMVGRKRFELKRRRHSESNSRA